jgi:hypothetical protein
MIDRNARVAIYKLHFTFSGAFMSNSPLNPNLTLKSKSSGRYDKLHAAGMATRFVKGTSGNPNGRPRNRPRITSTDVKRFIQIYRE